jgi:hypothetical protein
MAEYSKVSRSMPSLERTTLITDVAVNDRIDIEEILGRPARGVKFFMTASTDELGFRLNSLKRLRKPNESSVDSTVLVWSAGPANAVFTVDGQEVHQTEDALRVSSVEIVSLTLSSGSTIEMVVW